MLGIVNVLGSRRFISAVVGLVFMLLTSYLPDLEPYAPKLQEYAVILVIALISGYSLQDIVREFKQHAGEILELVEEAAKVTVPK